MRSPTTTGPEAIPTRTPGSKPRKSTAVSARSPTASTTSKPAWIARAASSSLFREFTPLVDQVVQAGSFIGAKAGIQHQVMCRYQNVDEIELQQAHLPNRTTKVTNIDLAFWPWSIKTLRCKGDAACLSKRDLFACHRIVS